MAGFTAMESQPLTAVADFPPRLVLAFPAPTPLPEPNPEGFVDDQSVDDEDRNGDSSSCLDDVPNGEPSTLLGALNFPGVEVDPRKVVVPEDEDQVARPVVSGRALACSFFCLWRLTNIFSYIFLEEERTKRTHTRRTIQGWQRAETADTWAVTTTWKVLPVSIPNSQL